MGIYEDVAAFVPCCEQEIADQRVMLERLAGDPDVFERTSMAHMTTSIWVVDPSWTQTLMVYHNIYRSWSWIGGHADGERDLATVALRELVEETGVTTARLVMPESGAERVASSAFPDASDEGADDRLGRSRPVPTVCQGGILSLEVLPVAGHERRGEYVSSHVHLNVTYLAEADCGARLRSKPDENAGVCWVPLDEVERVSSEPWMCERVYRKIIGRLRGSNSRLG